MKYQISLQRNKQVVVNFHNKCTLKQVNEETLYYQYEIRFNRAAKVTTLRILIVTSSKVNLNRTKTENPAMGPFELFYEVRPKNMYPFSVQGAIYCFSTS